MRSGTVTAESKDAMNRIVRVRLTFYGTLGVVQGPPAVELAWSRGAGAETCIDAGALADKVEATIGRRVDAQAALDADAPLPDGGPARLEGHVQAAGAGWIAVVQVRAAGPALRREVALDASDCRQFDEALVLVVALLAEAALPTGPRLTLPPRSPSATVGVGLDVAVAYGMLPGINMGVGLAAEVALPPFWHLAAWAHGWPTSSAFDDGSGGRLAAWTVGAGPCVGPAGRELWSLFGCVGASGGVVSATGVGLAVARTSAHPYLQGEARAGLRVRIAPPMFARLEAGVGLPIGRDSYEFTGADGGSRVVFRTAAVIPLARFSIEFRAP
jgi:hypothetical protein